jgi:hypothetical protein
MVLTIVDSRWRPESRTPAKCNLGRVLKGPPELGGENRTVEHDPERPARQKTRQMENSALVRTEE